MTIIIANICDKDGYPILLIPQGTKSGYITCKWGGCVDLSYPKSKTRRGRVIQNGEICPTITTGSVLFVIGSRKP